MMFKNTTIVILFFFLLSCGDRKTGHANKDLSVNLPEALREEKKSGYQGGFIKNMKTPENALSFLVVGDWGRNGQYHQVAVAEQMGNAAMTIDAEFIISVGDNFYPNGVASVNDPHWKSSFEEIYTSQALFNDWKVILGNHDYKGSPEAQIEYSKMSRRWHMPDYYYSEILSIDDDTTQKVLFAYIDTNPFVKKYYQSPSYKKNVSRQDTLAQKQWLDKVLGNPDPNIKWKIVVGHHPLYCGGKRVKSPETFDVRYSFEPLFKKHGVDAYLCGHEHDLQHIKPAGKTHHFVSGAGSEIRPTGNIPETKFAVSDFGFMAFSVLPDQMVVQVVNDKGVIIHTDEIKK